MQKLMKKILSIPYSIYVAVSFFLVLCILLVLFTPLLLIRNDRKRMRIIFWLNKLFIWKIWTNIAFLPVKVEGREKIKEDAVYVFVPNHSNMLDIVYTSSCIDQYYKPLVKKELLSFPVLGLLLRMVSLPVDRQSAESRKSSTQKMIEWLKSGIGLLIFPEGTRNRTPDPVKELYDGAFRVAIEAQASIAPIALINLRGLQPVDSIWFYPGKVTMRFLDPISTKGMTENDIDALRDKARKMIGDVLLAEDSFYKK
jgi:1-acyl-sn-glycerol-3-phosphate acyltransferase